MLSIKIYHVCGEKKLHLKTSMREEKLLPGSFIVKWGGVWDFWKAWPERYRRLLGKGIKMQHSEQGAQHLTWAAVRKRRTRAVARRWNHVLSPFPLRQHHLKQNPNLSGIFNIAILSYNRPDWLEILVQFKMLFVDLGTLFPHILLYRSSLSQHIQKQPHRASNSTHTPLGLTRCV